MKSYRHPNPKKRKWLIAALTLLLLVTFSFQLLAEEIPSETPTATEQPTEAPTDAPTEAPTEAPTMEPTTEPTSEPTEIPTPGETSPQPTTPTVTVTPSPTVPVDTPAVFILLGDMSVTTGEAGQPVALILPLLNWGNIDLEHVLVTPVMSPDAAEYPFEIERTDYSITLDKPLKKTMNPADRYKNIYPVELGQFKIKKDAKSGYYRIACKIRYQLPAVAPEEVERFLYVRVQNPADGNDPGQAPSFDPGYDPGSFSSGYSSGAGFSSAKPSVPRLITTGFTTNPAKVFGGSEFTLNLKIKNTSDKTAVSNIRMALETTGEEATFLPQSGSATAYIKSIDKDTEIEVNIPLTVSSTLQQKTYPLTVKFEFEDSEGTQHTASETISIPVLQEARIDFGKVEIMPQELTVGRDANIIFSIFNKGKSKLYNVSVLIEDELALAKQEVYLGNVDSGAIKDVDMMATALMPHAGSPIPLVIRYEDTDGNAETTTLDIDLTIMEEMPADFGPEGPEPFGPSAEMTGDEQGTFTPEQGEGLTTLQIALIAGGGALLLLTVALIVRARRRKKKLALLDEDE